ncbi:DUF1156 domain-containing protein [Sphaerisporangium sp. NPDC004334]
MTTNNEAGTPGYRRKLIEVALPLEEINKQSAREKSIRHGHPSTLHLWWARRPLAACRAVLFAQLVDDPSSRPDEFPSEEDQTLERKRLFNIIERLVDWDNINDKGLYEEARSEILKSCDGKMPSILDPFAGGGSIPLEAQRLGLDAHASDLNPVPVLINKALIEIPPKWRNKAPIFPGAAKSRLGEWQGASGLAEDVRRYGEWIRNEAKRRIGNLYPHVRLGDGTEAPIIAWFWVRTATCPNPTCGGTMPLANGFWLSNRKGKERYAEPTVHGKRVKFEVRGPKGNPREGTVNRQGAVCLICETPVPLSYVRSEGRAGRLGAQLMAIAAEGPRSRYYVAPPEDHERIAKAVSAPDDVPEGDLPDQALGFRIQAYGLTSWADLFTNRQLTLLACLVDLIEAAVAKSLSEGASRSYANDLAVYLTLLLGRVANRHSSQSFWHPGRETVEQVFGRNALPMIWVYAEANPFSSSSGNINGQLDYLVEALERTPARGSGSVIQQDAVTIGKGSDGGGHIISTDPPYYDNIPYADLSDFFYVWHRKPLGGVLPELYGTVATPKAEEMIAEPARAGSKAAATRFFEERLRMFFEAALQVQGRAFPLTLFYAFKQSENEESGTASTGWETMLQALIDAGAIVAATWPVRTEQAGGLRQIGRNALASSIVLACRPRADSAEVIDRRGLISALKGELPGALRDLQQGGVAPVDLAQAAIGPGMATFSRYAQVTEADGSPMRVRAALMLINQILAEVLSDQEGDFDSDTRFCVKWFESYGFDEGVYGVAETLSKATNTSVEGLSRAGVLRSRDNRVQLFGPEDLTPSYDPQMDDRVSVWEVVMHLAKRLDEQGIEAAGQLMAAAKMRIDLDTAKELAYLLFSICERRNWAKTALLFNALGSEWTEIEKASRSAVPAVSAQGTLDFSDGED